MRSDIFGKRNAVDDFTRRVFEGLTLSHLVQSDHHGASMAEDARIAIVRFSNLVFRYGLDAVVASSSGPLCSEVQTQGTIIRM